MAETYFKPPLGDQTYVPPRALLPGNRPVRSRQWMMLFCSERASQPAGAGSTADQGIEIDGIVYGGGRWHGPLTAAQITAITTAGHGARLFTVDSHGELPAWIDG